jgi:hypothetical protein
MKLEAIIAEVYTFVDFTKHEYYKAQRRGENSYTTHLAGVMPEGHPMPYNVYIPVRKYLKKNPEEIDDVIDYLYDEFNKKDYNFKNISVTESVYVDNKGLFKKKWPQIDVTLEW